MFTSQLFSGKDRSTPWTTISVLPPFSPMVSGLMDHHRHHSRGTSSALIQRGHRLPTPARIRQHLHIQGHRRHLIPPRSLPKRTLSMVSHPLDHHRQFTPFFADGVPPNGPPSALGRHLGQHPGRHPVSTPVGTGQRRGSSAAKNMQKSFRFLDKSAIFVLVDGPASTDSELFVRFVFWRFVWNSGLSLQII